MRAVIYARVSTDPHGGGRSVTEQVDECRAIIVRNGWSEDRTFVDNDRSASRYAKKSRPKYVELQEYVKAGGTDVVVTWEASRFQRDLEDYVRLRELCRANGVLWSYSGRTYDLSRTDDRMITGLDALLAERESDITRDRILRTVRANAAKGRPHGRLPYGYTREYDPTSGVLLRQVIREDQAAIVREAARRVVAGESCNSIAVDLNRRGVPAPHSGRWDLTRIRRLVTSPTYVAQRVHQGVQVGAADWPAILDDATFLRCVALMSDPARRTSTEHGVKYLLSGIALCGVCGSTVKVMPQRAGYKTYICRRFCVARKLVWVDDAVEQVLVARFSRPDAAALFAPPDVDSTHIVDEIAAKRTRLDSFYQAAADGSVTPVGLAKIETQLLAEIAALEAQVRRYDAPAALPGLAAAPLTWKRLTLEQKRAVVLYVCDVVIHPTVSGRHAFDPERVEVRWRRSPAADSSAPG